MCVLFIFYFIASITQDLLRKAVTFTLKDESFSIDSPLVTSSRHSASQLLVWIERNENKEKLELVLTPIFQQLEEAFQSTARSIQTRREKMWGQYHTIRTSDHFVQSWILLFNEAGTQALPTLFQHLTHLIFKEMILIHFPISELPQPMTSESPPTMPYQQANAIRYVAGYVCRAVRKKIQASNSLLEQKVLLAIWELLEDDDPVNSSSSDEEKQPTSSDWVESVNRGGLLRVTDNAYLVFARIEAVVQTHFTVSKLTSITDGLKDELIRHVVSDDEVQFLWSMVSADMSEEVSEELLKKIANLWITIWGHSFSKCYVEMYKQRQKKITSRSKGFRKELFTSKIQ